MIWFTSDLHLGHEAVIRMQNRPFKDAAEMDNALIHNLNECVRPNDKLYILGDVSHHLTPEQSNTLIKREHPDRKLVVYEGGKKVIRRNDRRGKTDNR